jgi:GntR family transcriptional regulator
VSALGDRTLDRASPMPLWAQIVADLRARIAAGAFDERFPTDEELTASYGVSRQTAREAVRRLQAEGLLERRRGRGTTLTRPVLEQPLGALYSVALTVSGHGLAERSEIRTAERRGAPGWVADGLRIERDAPVVFLERLRFAGDEPLSLERSWLPWRLAGGLVGANLEHGPLYGALAEVCGVQVTSGNERISPVLPPAEDRALLRMPARTAAFLVERLAVAADRPVELRRSTVRGDRYRFVAEWPARS